MIATFVTDGNFEMQVAKELMLSKLNSELLKSIHHLHYYWEYCTH